jgi:hypothetical protein
VVVRIKAFNQAVGNRTEICGISPGRLEEAELGRSLRKKS